MIVLLQYSGGGLKRRCKNAPAVGPFFFSFRALGKTAIPDGKAPQIKTRWRSSRVHAQRRPQVQLHRRVSERSSKVLLSPGAFGGAARAWRVFWPREVAIQRRAGKEHVQMRLSIRHQTIAAACASSRRSLILPLSALRCR